jgi:hypothetical protein
MTTGPDGARDLGLDLPPAVLALLGARRLDRDGARGDRDELSALLDERSFPSHAPALDFEERFGGARLFEPDMEPAALVVGAYACLSASPYSHHERDLVPVIFGADDTVYSLDGRGRGWTCAAMVEGVSRPSARDGRQLLVQALLWRILSLGNFQQREGVHGTALASGAPLFADATSDHESWWLDEHRLVAEIPFGNGYPGPMTYALALTSPA